MTEGIGGPEVNEFRNITIGQYQLPTRTYVWHSGTQTLIAADECVLVTLTDAEAELVSDGVEEPSDKVARVLNAREEAE